MSTKDRSEFAEYESVASSSRPPHEPSSKLLQPARSYWSVVASPTTSPGSRVTTGEGRANHGDSFGNTGAAHGNL